MRMAKRGFVFTLDALLAVVTMGVFLSAISFLSSRSSVDVTAAILMKKRAGDALAVLDASGDLSTLNDTTINSSLEKMLAPSLFYHARIEYYYYWSGGFNGSNVLDFGANQSSASQLVMAQREFLVFTGGRTQYYGVGRLWVWEQ